MVRKHLTIWGDIGSILVPIWLHPRGLTHRWMPQKWFSFLDEVTFVNWYLAWKQVQLQDCFKDFGWFWYFGPWILATPLTKATQAGNQDWAVQAAPLSKTPFLEIAGLKKRVGYASYFGYFEWVRWTVMLPVMEENPALPLIWIFINWWLGARFLLSTVLRPSCSLGLVMGIHFSYAGGGTREVASALRAGCCTRRGKIGGSCWVDFQIGNLSQITQYFRGGWR